MRRALGTVVVACVVGAGCAQIFGIDPPNEVADKDSGSPDATQGTDGSPDATGGDATGGDATGGDATTDSGGGDATAGGDSGAADTSSGDAPVDAKPSCDAAVAWAKMFASPIVPPYRMAGLDLRGADDGGITIQEIQAAACVLFDGGAVSPGEWNAYWGGDGSPGSAVISVNYDPSSGRYAFMFISPGYTGALDFHGADGGAAYHMSLTGDVTKNDASFPLDWADWNTDASVIENQVTELRNAMVATYAPGTPPSANCKLDQTCNVAPQAAGTGFFGVRAPLFFYANINDTINHPSQPGSFYTDTNFLQFNDPTQSPHWQSFDTTQLGSTVKSFAGVGYAAGAPAMYLVPAGPTPFVSFNVSSDAFASADGGAWSTFDPSSLTPAPQGFAGGEYDGQFVFYAGTGGICAQYDTTASFTFPGAWTTFDTKTLPAPAGKGFAGVVPLYSSAALFVPSQDGAIAVYSESAAPSDFAVGGNWLTYDLTQQVNPRLKQFHGAVTIEYGGPHPIYLVPNKDTMFAAYAGWPAAPGTASSWSFFDVSTVNASAPGYATGVHDQVRYVYFSPAVAGYPPVRYDTTQPFDSAAAWQVGLSPLNINVKATGFDGRYVYFVGDSTNVYRYDSTLSFTQSPGAWSGPIDVSAFDSHAVAFGGTGSDGRYQYFIPESSSVAMRFDARFGAPLPRSTYSSF